MQSPEDDFASAISSLGSYAFLMLITVIMGFGFMFLVWLAFARFGSSKEQWQKEKKTNVEMAMVGAAFVVLMSLLAALSE